MIIPKVLSLIVLLLLFIQDAKSREVHWVLFPLLVIAFTWIRWVSGGFPAVYFEGVLANCSFLVLQGILVWCYFSWKNGRWMNITGELLGPGDILFLLSVAFCFSPVSYIVFYVLSLCLVMLLYLVGPGIRKETDRRIPLAGMQALVLAFFLATAWWVFPLNLANDDWIVRIIYP